MPRCRRSGTWRFKTQKEKPSSSFASSKVVCALSHDVIFPLVGAQIAPFNRMVVTLSADIPSLNSILRRSADRHYLAAPG
jgi:hypothetical protein